MFLMQQLESPRSSPSPTSIQTPSGHRRVLYVLLGACIIWLSVEIALQIRSHVRYGQSVLNVLVDETRYVVDPATGLKLLRPNRTFVGSQSTVKTNSLGLRSPEISITPAPGSLRIAVLGASTVMGAYARTNEETFPALLEQLLRSRHPSRRIDVINAGIPGYTLEDQVRMLRSLIPTLKPNLVIVYPGFNDFAGYCRSSASDGLPTPQSRRALPHLQLPSWLLSVELLKKNTVFLRTTAVRSQKVKKAEDIDIAPYAEALATLIRAADEIGLPLAIATNARAYRPDQPYEVQMKLSEGARHFNHCFDLPGLHHLYDSHNNAIRDVAARYSIPVIDLDREIPGGTRYFADSTHFSLEGERLAARVLADFLEAQGIVGP